MKKLFITLAAAIFTMGCYAQEEQKTNNKATIVGVQVTADAAKKKPTIKTIDTKVAGGEKILAEIVKQNKDKVSCGDDEIEALDFALASCAVEEAVTRHAGTISETYTMMGQTFVQEGKNLTRVKQIVVTGGSLIHTERTEEIARCALYSPAHPESLCPKNADVWVDRKYILAAMGLLASHYPQTALRIMKKELEKNGYSE
jgi:uncharacterized protein (TIGR01319 family)